MGKKTNQIYKFAYEQQKSNERKRRGKPNYANVLM